MKKMPAVFIGHGSPMNALHPNRHTEAWSRFARGIERPRAILAVSAHWYVNGVAVTAMKNPRTIHDFYGFPDELFAVQYPAPGSEELAAQVVELLAPQEVHRDIDEWGLDHGTWSVLTHMYPDADVPVVQLSIDARKSFEEHLTIAAALRPLREQGVLIVASGNMVHNLSRMDWSKEDDGYDWAQQFDQWTRNAITHDPTDLVSAPKHEHYLKAVPTPEHFIPALYVAGLANTDDGVADYKTEIITGGCAYGSISMTSWALN